MYLDSIIIIFGNFGRIIRCHLKKNKLMKSIKVQTLGVPTRSLLAVAAWPSLVWQIGGGQHLAIQLANANNDVSQQKTAIRSSKEVWLYVNDHQLDLAKLLTKLLPNNSKSYIVVWEWPNS